MDVGAATMPLAEVLLAFCHWTLCECRNRWLIAAEGHYTHSAMQIGWREIQSPDDSVGTVPPAGSEHNTWMQAYTRRLLLALYNSHMLWLIAQRSLSSLCPWMGRRVPTTAK